MDNTSISYPLYTMGIRIPLTVGASPYVVQNPLNTPGEVFISGGTVTTIEFSRDQATWEVCGLLGGQFRLNPGDSLRVTYVVARSEERRVGKECRSRWSTSD